MNKNLSLDLQQNMGNIMKFLSINKNNIYSNVNILIFCVTALYISLAILFYKTISNFYEAFLQLFAVIIISILVIKIIKLVKGNIFKAVLQSSFVFVFFAYFFGMTSNFQLLLTHHWMDANLIAFDKTIFGMELSLRLQSLVNPYLTETMMFAYVIYIPLLLIAGFSAYKGAGSKGISEYLFVLSLGYIFCYLGFTLFPVASQMYFMPEKYIVPLKGGLFTYLSELIRSHLHFKGGSLPSPHCAAATIILWTCYKYYKKIFFVIIPSIFLLYISTVYGRFHYFMDSAIGILTGYTAILIHPLIIRLIDLIKVFINSILHPVSISNSLSEE